MAITCLIDPGRYTVMDGGNLKRTTLIGKWKLDLVQSVSKKSTSDKHRLCQSFKCFYCSECQDQGHKSEATNFQPIRMLLFLESTCISVRKIKKCTDHVYNILFTVFEH